MWHSIPIQLRPDFVETGGVDKLNETVTPAGLENLRVERACRRILMANMSNQFLLNGIELVLDMLKENCLVSIKCNKDVPGSKGFY
jgi:hypothetical protein